MGRGEIRSDHNSELHAHAERNKETTAISSLIHWRLRQRFGGRGGRGRGEGWVLLKIPRGAIKGVGEDEVTVTSGLHAQAERTNKQRREVYIRMVMMFITISATFADDDVMMMFITISARD